MSVILLSVLNFLSLRIILMTPNLESTSVWMTAISLSTSFSTKIMLSPWPSNISWFLERALKDFCTPLMRARESLISN